MKNVYGFEHMAMQHLADETRKTGWEWIDAHPRMETPPVWEPLEREVVDQSISRGEWCLFIAGVLFGVLGASLFV